MDYIDFHTHQSKGKGLLQILNVFAQDLSSIFPEYLFSTGLHPWHIEKVKPEDCIQAIEKVIERENLIAIGECGLDRSIATDFAIQEKCFKSQIQIANKYAKPLIIHCVRAYSDLIRIKKVTKSEVPWIIHGYQGNQHITRSLIAHGFYFSVGESFLKMNSKHDVLRNLPKDRIFLETDDAEVSIENTYYIAAEILEIEVELLISIIFRNFKNLFGVEIKKII